MATSASLLLGIVCFLEQSIWALCGSSPQPSIWAVPGVVISTGRSVTIFCRIPPGVSLVRLIHYADSGRYYDQTPLDSQEVAEFHLRNMMHSNAGTYCCEYSKQGEWLERKDRVELVVTGVYMSKPSLVLSGPQMSSGGNVTLQCHTHDFYGSFILCRHGNASFPQNCSQQDDSTFLVSSACPGEERTYRCFGSYKDKPYLWSLPSDPLVLSITGSSPQPSIWAVPGAVISTGSSVTIFCRTPPGVSHVRLSHYEHNGQSYDQTLLGAQEVAEFRLQNMMHIDAGIYYCEYYKQREWSVSKDRVELAVTGVYRNKPSLVHSRSQMGSGGNVTLQCHTHHFYGSFILCRDGNASFPQNCSPQDDSTFLISLASPREERTYRCSGSYKGVYSSKPFLMVHSGPQAVSGGNVTLRCHTRDFYGIFILCRHGNASFPQNCSQQDGNTFFVSPASSGDGRTYRCFGSYKDKPYLWSVPSDPLVLSMTDPPATIVVWVSVAALCLLLFLLLLILGLCLHRAKRRATAGKARSQVTYKSSSPDMDVKDEGDDLEGTQPEACRQVDIQVPASENPQEVTYAQLHREILMQNTNPLPSCTLQDPSTQTCVYASLTLSQ